MTTTAQHLELDDARIAFWVTGQGEPLVLLHASLSADWFLPVAEALTGFQVVRTHRAGYGESRDLAGDLGIPDHARHAAEVLRSLGISRAHWVGHSSGATVALQAAVDYPELVHSLVLLETARPYAPNERPNPATARAAKAAAAGRLDEGFDEFLQGVCGPGYRDAMVRQLGPEGLAAAIGSAGYFFGQEFPALASWKFGPDKAAAVRQPVLLVHGGESPHINPAYQERNRSLAAQLPNAERAVIPGVTHAMPLEDPAAVARTIAEFTGRHSFS
jgi:pimeloyl-ACP methyl ester carboxylesterase